MKLSKRERLELLETIFEKLIELKNDGGVGWKASMGLSMLMAWLQEEKARLAK